MEEKEIVSFVFDKTFKKERAERKKKVENLGSGEAAGVIVRKGNTVHATWDAP